MSIVGGGGTKIVSLISTLAFFSFSVKCSWTFLLLFSCTSSSHIIGRGKKAPTLMFTCTCVMITFLCNVSVLQILCALGLLGPWFILILSESPVFPVGFITTFGRCYIVFISIPLWFLQRAGLSWAGFLVCELLWVNFDSFKGREGERRDLFLLFCPPTPKCTT